MAGREIYVEIIAAGNALRVAAVDAETGTELVFQVPAKTARAEIDRLARAKVEWKLARDSKGRDDASDNEKRPDTGSGRGIRV